MSEDYFCVFQMCDDDFMTWAFRIVLMKLKIKCFTRWFYVPFGITSNTGFFTSRYVSS